MVDREVSVGAILAGTYATVRDNLVAVAVYVAFFSVASGVADYVGQMSSPETKIAGGLLQIASSLVSIVGGYLLTKHMLKHTGLYRNAGPRRILRYMGQAILAGLGIIAGLVLFIVPGIILALRWSIAAPAFISESTGAVEGLERSWQLTKGHGLRIFLASLPLLLGYMMLVGFLAVIAGTGAAFGYDSNFFSIVILNVGAESLSVLMAAFSVALYGLLVSSGSDVGDVFS